MTLAALLLLHARFAGWVQDLGLALGCAAGFIALLLAWCGLSWLPAADAAGWIAFGWLCAGRWPPPPWPFTPCAATGSPSRLEPERSTRTPPVNWPPPALFLVSALGVTALAQLIGRGFPAG